MELTDVVRLLMTLTLNVVSVRPTPSYNYDVVDEHTGWVLEMPGRTVFQLAAVGRDSGHLFIAARDRLLIVDCELNLLRSVNLTPRCRRDKRHRQLVTPCSRHNDALLLRLLPTVTSSRTGVLLEFTCL